MAFFKLASKGNVYLKCFIARNVAKLKQKLSFSFFQVKNHFVHLSGNLFFEVKGRFLQIFKQKYFFKFTLTFENFATKVKRAGTARKVKRARTARRVKRVGTARKMNRVGTARRVKRAGTARKVKRAGTSRRVNILY